MALVVAYSAAGAVLFEWLEADQEIQPRRHILQIRLDCLTELRRINPTIGRHSTNHDGINSLTLTLTPPPPTTTTNATTTTTLADDNDSSFSKNFIYFSFLIRFELEFEFELELELEFEFEFEFEFDWNVRRNGMVDGSFGPFER